MNILNNKDLISHSPQETFKFAEKLLNNLPDKAVIAMHGDLGTGKTCFVQGLAMALGIKQHITSPTFTIINEYKGKKNLYHIDLYRLNNPDEILMLGLDGYLEPEGITAIEWAERAGDLIPYNTTHIYFKTKTIPNERSIFITIH